MRISVRENADGTGAEIDTADSMQHLIPYMVSGHYNPGQLQIVREILMADGSDDFDTAKFSRALFVDDGNGNLVQQYDIRINGNLATLDPDGVNSFDIGANDIVTVTDLVGGDGTDTLKHIERLAFTDQTIVLVAGADHEPVGAVTLLGTAAEDQPLTIALNPDGTLVGVTDADNVSLANPTGGISPPVAYFWQVETVPDSGAYEDILLEPAAGEAARVGA